MAYTALYRKFRPEVFDEVKGQTAVVRTLQNQVKAGRMSHAYLFCGTRGTGKTTIAKIMAKAVNCESPQNGNPCGTCPMCRSIAEGTSMNVIEIDAASNNGVDNIREIVEEVRYSPTEGHYKVYIIDEVHMLSAGAFNALLKTLEEPPAYVIFILATTEAHKLPITILSRCQRYDFTRITVEDITDRLTDLVGREGLSAEPRALQYIARAADGGMRDALSLLDRCIAFYPGESLTYDNVLEILGTVDLEVFGRMIRAIRTGDVAETLRIFDGVVNRGRDIGQFISDFTWYMRNLLLAETVERPEEFLDIPSEQLPGFLEEAASNEPEVLVRYINICSDLVNRIRYSAQKRVLTEVALIRLCRPDSDRDYNALTDRVRKLEEQLENGVVTVAGDTQVFRESEALQPEQKAELPKAIHEDICEVAQRWSEIVAAAGMPVRLILQAAKPSVNKEGAKLLLVYESRMQAVNAEGHAEEIGKVLSAVTQKEISFGVEFAGEGRQGAAAYPDLKDVLKNMPVEFID